MVMVGAGYMFLKIIQTIPHGGEVLEWGKSSVDSSAGSVGKILFSEYLLPFEIIGVLLLMATVGVVILSQSRETKE